MKKIILLLCLVIVGQIARGYTVSGTNYTTNGSATDVQNACTAAPGGATVIVPAGSFTWANVVSLAKAITLQGAGIDQTIITSNMGSISQWCLAMNGNFPAGSVQIVSGFTFNTIPSSQNGIVAIGCTGFRLTNCKFNCEPSNDTSSDRALTIWAPSFGVVDHCIFNNPQNRGQAISFKQCAVDLVGCLPWFEPQALGSINASYVESCTFNFTGGGPGDGAFDAYDGSCFVFRNNIVNGTNMGWHGADSGVHAPRLFEIYNNTINNPGPAIYTAIRSRGGSGVIWGNTITGNWNGFIILSEYRTDPSYSLAADGPIGNIDGHFSDGTHPGATGWPLLDQTGRGSFPGAANTAAINNWPNSSSYDQAHYEASTPLYQWNNNYQGNTSPTCAVSNLQNEDLAHLYIVQGKDYFDNVPAPGYTPLVYPHPLVTSVAFTVPIAPQNLRISP